MSYQQQIVGGYFLARPVYMPNRTSPMARLVKRSLAADVKNWLHCRLLALFTEDALTLLAKHSYVAL